MPNDYTLITTLVTAEGEPLSTTTTTGGGTGSVYKGDNGGGELVAGTVATIGEKEVILNIGFKSEGSVQVSDY